MKRVETEAIEKMEELRKTIEASPLTQKIKEDQAAVILAKRKAAAEVIESLRKEQAENLPKLQNDLKEKEAKLKEAKAALDSAASELRTSQAAMFRENSDFHSAIGTHEQVLFDTYDPKIDETITFFREKMEELRKPGRISSRGMKVERNIFTDTKILTVETNKDAVLSALGYCQAAIKGFEALKLSPEFHIKEIEEIKKAIPDIDVYSESSSKKPLPGSKGIDPRAFLKSDSQKDWEQGKLNEKFKKVMGRK